MKTSAISIVIPTWNEKNNIHTLISEIVIAMRLTQQTYELIFVDDHSTDGTVEEINKYASDLPITVILKEGRKGKSFSLLQGVKVAAHPIIITIDADLQYSPLHIPELIDRINHGVDLVIAERTKHDHHSGLKIFRKEILERIKLHPKTWALHRELIKKSIDAGYRVEKFKVKKKYTLFKSNKDSIIM